MSKERLTRRRAVWLGLLGTPVVLIAAITLLGVAAGGAGPSTTAAPSGQSATAQTASGPVSQVTALGRGAQTLSELKAYWTPERMANAKPFPLPGPTGSTEGQGSVQTIPKLAGEIQLVRMNADGSVERRSVPDTTSANAMTEPLHTQVPYDRWEYFGKYLKIGTPPTNPNTAIATLHKMFFSMGVDDFVCSSSTIGTDGVWTAGHCVHDGASGGAGFSTNVLFCPAYDSSQGGVNPTAGCWGASELWTWCPEWCTNGNLEYDFGGADATDNPVLGPQSGLIGNYTGANGLSYVATDGFGAHNTHFLALGYPAGAPFTGGKIHVCSSQFGYVDDSDGTAAGTSVAIGCDMTGGSSGGPWLRWFGKPGQIGGAANSGVCCNYLNGHNDWGHVGGGSPAEMNAPYFNCRAIDMYTAINDLSAITCP